MIIQMDVARFTKDHARAYLNEKWEILPYGNEDAASKKHIKFNKPKKLKEMIEIAKKLSSDFDYVRVDLYEVEGKIYFGELTFTDGSGYDLLKPDKYDIEWGTYWNEKK